MRAAAVGGEELRAALREVRIVFYYHFFKKPSFSAHCFLGTRVHRCAFSSSSCIGRALTRRATAGQCAESVGNTETHMAGLY